jgi:hypothetical protein
LRIRVEDGNHQPFKDGVPIDISAYDRKKDLMYRSTVDERTAQEYLPFVNLSDQVAEKVVIFKRGFHEVTFHISELAEGVSSLNIMLVPLNGDFDFRSSHWQSIRGHRSQLHALMVGHESDSIVAARWEALIERQPMRAAAFLIISNALSEPARSEGNLLQYYKEVVWDSSMAQDRFFAYAAYRPLVAAMEARVAHGTWDVDRHFKSLHKGLAELPDSEATSSYKETDLRWANVQVTLHEHNHEVIDGVDCVLVETDMDYYKNPIMHDGLEVGLNMITGSKTDPRKVFFLRSLAEQFAGWPQFSPPVGLVPHQAEK